MAKQSAKTAKSVTSGKKKKAGNKGKKEKMVKKASPKVAKSKKKENNAQNDKKALCELVVKGKKQGYLTYEEINEALSKEMLVSESMTTEVYSVGPDATIAECMGIFTQRRIRHLPVVETGRVVGLVSIGDVVKKLIANLEYTVHDLENYITGGGYGADIS